MDKLAAGIIDKLSIIGFFNVIISGGVLLYGFSPILGRYVPGIFYMQLGLQKDLEKGIIICLVCYIFGSALQSIQVLFFKGLKDRRRWVMNTSWWQLRADVIRGQIREVLIYCVPTVCHSKIMASGPITSWQIYGETVETVTNFIFLVQNYCRW